MKALGQVSLYNTGQVMEDTSAFSTARRGGCVSHARTGHDRWTDWMSANSCIERDIAPLSITWAFGFGNISRMANQYVGLKRAGTSV